MDADTDIVALARLIERAHRIVLFTGAGISTESGIPDFRGPNGIWGAMAPIDFDSFLASETARCETWRRRLASDAVLRAARPNRGHRALASLVRDGRASAVITQNIDGLHQESEIADEQVIELHGNTTYATCLDCAERHEIADLGALFTEHGTSPRCTRCRGFVKPATISFGQAMPERAMRRARAETLEADLFLVAGSSLAVYPAAGFPELAQRNGARLVIVNREPAPQDRRADLVLHCALGETLGAAVGVA